MSKPPAERVPQEMVCKLQLHRERAGRLKAEQRAARAEYDLAEMKRQAALAEAARVEQQMKDDYGMTNGDGLKEDGTIVREPPSPQQPPPAPAAAEGAPAEPADTPPADTSTN